MKLWHDLLRTRETGWAILVRLLVGLVVFFRKGSRSSCFLRFWARAVSRGSAFPMPTSWVRLSASSKRFVVF